MSTKQLSFMLAKIITMNVNLGMQITFVSRHMISYCIHQYDCKKTKVVNFCFQKCLSKISTLSYCLTEHNRRREETIAFREGFRFICSALFLNFWFAISSHLDLFMIDLFIQSLPPGSIERTQIVEFMNTSNSRINDKSGKMMCDFYPRQAYKFGPSSTPDDSLSIEFFEQPSHAQATCF